MMLHHRPVMVFIAGVEKFWKTCAREFFKSGCGDTRAGTMEMVNKLHKAFRLFFVNAFFVFDA